MDAGVTIAIIAQLLVTAIDLTHLKGGLDASDFQSILINFALLVFLLRNIADFKRTESAPVASPTVVKTEVKAASQ